MARAQAPEPQPAARCRIAAALAHRPVAWLLALLLCGPAMALAADAPAFTAEALMQQLAKRGGASARFVEKKHIAIVDEPIESRGELRFTAPDKLEKRTLQPIKEVLTLQGGTLRLERAGAKPMVMELGARPEAAALVESIRGTLAGDLTALRQHYALQVSGTADVWQLVLEPKAAAVKRMVRRVTLQGTRDSVRYVEVEQGDGDRSEMLITPTP